MTEDEKVGWHHGVNGHEYEQSLGDSEGRGNLACCSPWGRKESDTTERLNNINMVSRNEPSTISVCVSVCLCVCVCVCVRIYIQHFISVSSTCLVSIKDKTEKDKAG